MQYTLMHKNIPVLTCQMEDENVLYISKIQDVHSHEHLPLFLQKNKQGVDRLDLINWLKGRSIPASRSGLRDALDILQIRNQTELLSKCYCLSLSDQYWFRPTDLEATWEQVNFFTNPFSEDVGNALFGKTQSDLKTQLNLVSPDNTSDGWLKKRWKIINGTRCLLKGGSGANQQEPLNEVFASYLYEQIGYQNFVNYNLYMDGMQPYSICPNFVTPETELISAYQIISSRKQRSDISSYDHYLNTCEELGIPGVKESLNFTLLGDSLIANTDRHWGNFGVLRNAETLEWIGPAPIFDSGTSLWHNVRTNSIQNDVVSSKPFRKTHEEQIKLIKNYDWIDFCKINNLGEALRDMFERSYLSDEKIRIDKICNAYEHRVDVFKTLILEQHRKHVFSRYMSSPSPRSDFKKKVVPKSKPLKSTPKIKI